MWIIDGIIAGLIAGIFMGAVSQLGYWLGILKSNLIVIDGNFAIRRMKQNPTNLAIYFVGILIHLVMSVIFGTVYVVIAKLVGFDFRVFWAIATYVLVLWLAMLVVALPIAGQGFLGNKIRQSVWLEQFILHIIFGVSFWWALGTV